METFFGSSGAQRLFFWSPPVSLRNGDSLLGAPLVPIGTETPSWDGDSFLEPPWFLKERRLLFGWRLPLGWLGAPLLSLGVKDPPGVTVL